MAIYETIADRGDVFEARYWGELEELDANAKAPSERSDWVNIGDGLTLTDCHNAFSTINIFNKDHGIPLQHGENLYDVLSSNAVSNCPIQFSRERLVAVGHPDLVTATQTAEAWMIAPPGIMNIHRTGKPHGFFESESAMHWTVRYESHDGIAFVLPNGRGKASVFGIANDVSMQKVRNGFSNPWAPVVWSEKKGKLKFVPIYLPAHESAPLGRSTRVMTKQGPLGRKLSASPQVISIERLNYAEFFPALR